MARPVGRGRFFTPEEVNELLPRIRRVLRNIDGLMARSRRARERLEALDTYWGEEILRPDTPDHATYEGLQEELEEVLRAIDVQAGEIHDMGGHVKSYEAGLVDFYARRKGRTVLLCWRRGEPRVAFYHDLEAGYAGRKPLGDDSVA